MATLTFTITTPQGNRTRTFTFPDEAVSRLIAAYSRGGTAAETIDALFHQIMTQIKDHVLNYERQQAAIAAEDGVSDIPVTE